MLGEAITDVVTIEVSYRHSLLPFDTTLTTMATASVRRHMPDTPWSPNRSPTKETCESNQEQVQKHLAFFIATTHTPRDGLSALDDIFGDADCRSSCPSFMKQVIEELTYRARVTERSHALTHSETEQLPELEGDFVFESQLADITNRQERDLDPDSTPTQAQHSSPVAASPYPSPTEKGDDATKIWRSMRKSSKVASTTPTHRPATARGENTPPSSSHPSPVRDHMSELKRAALRNQRSVGQDTLYSIALSESRRPSGGGSESAPWL
jgi:hypothetical protein